jgi:hypothetical protein
MPRDSGYGFAVFPAGVVFDLLADDTVMCMVHSTLEHGTAALDKKLAPGCAHDGIGVVIINKDSMA